MNHLSWTFTFICSYGLIFLAGAPQGTMNYGTTRWSFFCFLHYLRFYFRSDPPKPFKALSDTFVILSAFSAASEAFSATSEASEVLSAASGALAAAFKPLRGP